MDRERSRKEEQNPKSVTQYRHLYDFINGICLVLRSFPASRGHLSLVQAWGLDHARSQIGWHFNITFHLKIASSFQRVSKCFYNLSRDIIHVLWHWNRVCSWEGWATSTTVQGFWTESSDSFCVLLKPWGVLMHACEEGDLKAAECNCRVWKLARSSSQILS